MLARAHPSIANQHYCNMELQSRVASASPPGVVSLLSEELLRSLDLLTVTVKPGSAISGNPHHSKALSIIIALESSIDFANGGDLARVLQRIYRSVVHTLNGAARADDMTQISELQSAIREIASAWAALTD